MESLALGADDLFDMGAEEAEEYGSVAPMPDLESDMPTIEEENDEAGDEGDTDGDVLAKLKDIKGAAKKRTLKPQPKLDGTRLTGDRGLPLLLKTFQGVKFKGRGHEASDLKLVMTKLEHWAHRLFPKMTFDEVIDRVEKLGAKREVQTCVKRIRLDMPLMNGEYLSEPADDEADTFGMNGNAEINEDEVMDAEAAYDEMVRLEREAMEQGIQQDASTKNTNTAAKPQETNNMSQTPSDVHNTTIPSTPVSASTPSKQGLTPEQKERLERNKMKALEKKAARLGVPLSSLLPPKPKDNENRDSDLPNTSNNLDNSQVSTTETPPDSNQTEIQETSEKKIQSDNTPNEDKDDESLVGMKEDANIVYNSEADCNEENVQTADEIMDVLDMDEELLEGTFDKGSHDKVDCEQKQMKVCSEPLLDSVPVNEKNSTKMQSSIDNTITDGERISDTLLQNSNNTSADCIVNSKSTSPLTNEKSNNETPIVQSKLDENDDTRKSSCEELQLHFSESDTTNTTQEEDDIEQDSAFIKDSTNTENTDL